MRGRNKPWADQFIKEHPQYIYQKDTKINQDSEIYLEIGMGKGDFIIQSCKYYPQILHLGIELNKSIFAIALKKIVQEEISNLYVMQLPAAMLLDYLKPHSISKIFLNFSDPWPKKRYYKRRLVHPNHLIIFEQLLKENGQIIVKTDNRSLFEYGLENFKERGYQLDQIDYQYQTIQGDFVSEYEARFRLLNQPIHRCVATVNFKKEENK